MGNSVLSQLLNHGHDLRMFDRPAGRPLLECTPRGVGYEQRRNEAYAWGGQSRGNEPFLVLQHTTFGAGCLDYDGTEYRLRPGHTMLVTIPHRHRYWLERGGKWEYFWLLLTGREALRIAREILAHSGPVLQLEPEAVDRMAAACHGLLATEMLTQGAASSLGYAALAALQDGCFGTQTQTPNLPTALERVIGFVEDHLAEALSVDRLARVAGMSRAHFVRKFTETLGGPPSEFVLNRRLARIERLLLATEMTVREIAAATGFADGNYLAKSFRRARGMSPLAFRATRSGAP